MEEIKFIDTLPDWYQTQNEFQRLTERMKRNEEEHFLSDEEREELILQWRNYFCMLNVETYNVLPI